MKEEVEEGEDVGGYREEVQAEDVHIIPPSLLCLVPYSPIYLTKAIF